MTEENINFNKLLALSEQDFIKLVFNNKQLLSNKNLKNENILHLFCFFGQTEKFIISVNIIDNINYEGLINKEGNNLLHYLSNSNNFDFFLPNYLLKQKLYPNSTNLNLETPIHFVINIELLVYYHNWMTRNNLQLNSLITKDGYNIYDYIYLNKKITENNKKEMLKYLTENNIKRNKTEHKNINNFCEESYE